MKKLIAIIAMVALAGPIAPAQARERKSGWAVFKAAGKIGIGTFLIIFELKELIRGATMDKDAARAEVNQWREQELAAIPQQEPAEQHVQAQGAPPQDAFVELLAFIQAMNNGPAARRASVGRVAARRIAEIDDRGSFGISNVFWMALGSAFIYSGYKDFVAPEDYKEKNN